MADSDKNILITPNTGVATVFPKIEFTGFDVNTLTLSVLDSGALSISGTSGQLFSITDDLTGSIFSVNDISGIPSIEVFDSGVVSLAEFGGNVGIGTSTPTSKLDVVGDLTLSNTAPSLFFTETDATANNKTWILGATLEVLYFGARNDLDVEGQGYWQFDRTDNDIISFRGFSTGGVKITLDNVAGTIAATGDITTNGNSVIHTGGGQTIGGALALSGLLSANANVTISNTVPTLNLTETGVTNGDARIVVDGEDLYLQTATTGNLYLSAYGGADAASYGVRIGGLWKDILHTGGGQTITDDLAITGVYSTQNLISFSINNSTTNKTILFIPSTSTGGYNPLTIAGDQGIFFRGLNAGDGTGVIGTHGTVDNSVGIRFDGPAQTMTLEADNGITAISDMTINGSLTLSGIDTSEFYFDSTNNVGKVTITGIAPSIYFSDTNEVTDCRILHNNINLNIQAPSGGAVRLAGNLGTVASYLVAIGDPVVYEDIVHTGGSQTISGNLAVDNLSFPATKVPSADADTLDDYEEGTWTPVLSDGTNNATMLYGSGRYIKIGKKVYLEGAFQTNGLGSVSGEIRITGLPITSAGSLSGTYSAGGISPYSRGFNITAGSSVSIIIEANATFARLAVWDSTLGTTFMTDTEWTTDGSMGFGIEYTAAS